MTVIRGSHFEGTIFLLFWCSLSTFGFAIGASKFMGGERGEPPKELCGAFLSNRLCGEHIGDLDSFLVGTITSLLTLGIVILGIHFQALRETSAIQHLTV